MFSFSAGLNALTASTLLSWLAIPAGALGGAVEATAWIGVDSGAGLDAAVCSGETIWPGTGVVDGVLADCFAWLALVLVAGDAFGFGYRIHINKTV